METQTQPALAERYQGQYLRQILDEVGTRDIWPAISESVTFGYGSARTFRFRRPVVHDRWHNGVGLGFFLSADSCRTFWCSFLRDSSCILGANSPESPRFWLLLISNLKIQYVVLALVADLAFYSVVHQIWSGVSCPEDPSNLLGDDFVRCVH
jgi:hypothetical protein